MNGTYANYVKHAGLGALIVALCGLAGSLVWGGVVATVYFWAKEAGEKSKDWAAIGRPWSDWDPFNPRWSKDDRYDLLSGVVGGWACALVLWVIW